MKWEELRTEIWAKSPVKGQSQGELLDEHTAEVLRRLAQLRRRFPRLAEQAEDERLWHRMFWACFLHDIGKAAPPWQSYIRGNSPRWRHRHEVVSLAFLPWVIDVGSADFPWVAAAIVSHHRDGSVIDSRYPVTYPDSLALDTMFTSFEEHTLRGLLAWLAEAPQKWVIELGLQGSGIEFPSSLPRDLDPTKFCIQEAPKAVVHALRSYRRLRRELEDSSPALNRTAILYRGLMLLADRLASAHADPLLEFSAPAPDRLLAGRTARHHQHMCTTVSGSVIVTAPTGSGKTEAALIWAQRQQSENPHHRSLFYVLPYQASINAMHLRLGKDLATDIGLLHGRSTQVLYRLLLSEGYNSREAEQAARWARNLAGLQRPAVQVTTPYQLLRAAYRLKGFETIWTALSSALLIIDEVHAYDAQRLGLLLGLLHRLIRDWGAKVCAVTATMPSWLRELLQKSLQATLIGASDADFQVFRRHKLYLQDGSLDSPAVLDGIRERVERGEAVLVTANTVRGAQQVWSYLRDISGGERVSLLHSRFTARDRLAHESKLIERYGLDRLSRQPGVVVATQTIEVSLNLDFDTIVSEPAPLEALAQRFGRVNRTGRLPLAPVHVLTAPTDGQGVYDDRLVERTLKALSASDGQPMDEAALTAKLDDVYAGDLAREFQERVQTHQDMFERFCLNQLRAFESDDLLEEQFDQLFDGIEVLPSALEEEFHRAIERSTLEASGYLVPITYRQFAILQRQRKVRPGPEQIWIVDVPYSPVSGLQLSSQQVNTH